MSAETRKLVYVALNIGLPDWLDGWKPVRLVHWDPDDFPNAWSCRGGFVLVEFEREQNT